MSKVTITGGAGFIGANLARRLLYEGHHVTVFDNLSRSGGDNNIKWLEDQAGSENLNFIQGDLRDFETLKRATDGAERMYHLAGQVAVTTSVTDPRADFEANALGTFNALEAARQVGNNPVFVYSSTNKVYGGMEEIAIVEGDTRYAYADFPEGVPETTPLDFHSPYGCSKGAGDQYVRDYYRMYGVRSVVMRQSCLAASQTVVTPFGMKEIQHIKEGDWVHSGRGWTKVTKVWQTGVKPVRRLTTLNGLKVTATSDHRFMRPHGLFTNRDFAYGDFLAVLPEAKYTPQWEAVAQEVLDAEEYLARVYARTDDLRCHNAARQIAYNLLPLKGDKLLAVAEVVGWLFGDGNLSIHHRAQRANPAYQVQYYGSEQELSAISERLEWLGLPPSAIIDSYSTSELPSGHVIEGHSLRIQQQSLPIFTLFELLGVPVGDKVRTEYGLPVWVKDGHPLVKRAFLRGIFGAELSQPNPSTDNCPSFVQTKDVEFLEAGRAWVTELRDLITEFGIATSVSEGKPTTYKKGTTSQFTVRFLGGREFAPRLAAIGYGFNAKHTQHLNAMLRWQWSHTTPEHFEAQTTIYRADGHLFWDNLALVEPLQEEPVFDLEVADERHLFLAGGVQVSNCIYGYRQFGIEDQGWVAWFVIAALKKRNISIFGNGKQVRDVLFIEDLLDAYDAAVQNIDKSAGQIYNVGGGPQNTMAIWTEFGPILEELLGREVPVHYGDWRPGDQPVYISNIDKAKRELGWEPKVGVKEGVTRLYNWVKDNLDLFDHL